MIEIPQDAPGSTACGRSGLPLLAICSNGHRRTIPFRLLTTGNDDRTPLYDRPFKCKACGSREVTLFAFEATPNSTRSRARALGRRKRLGRRRPIRREIHTRALCKIAAEPPAQEPGARGGRWCRDRAVRH